MHYIACDPNLDTRRVNKNLIDLSSISVSTVANATDNAANGKGPSCYYKGKVGNLVKFPGVINVILKRSIPIVYSYSLSYTRNLFHELYYRGVIQIGCCYIDDDI